MNEDIKSILDVIKKYYDGLGWSYNPDDILKGYEVKMIYDYIIQLQNNWNELKKYVQEELKEAENDFAQEDFIKVLDRMQELE